MLRYTLPRGTNRQSQGIQGIKIWTHYGPILWIMRGRYMEEHIRAGGGGHTLLRRDGVPDLMTILGKNDLRFRQGIIFVGHYRSGGGLLRFFRVRLLLLDTQQGGRTTTPR